MKLLFKNAANCLDQRSGWLDRIAIIMAVVCSIHCLITPVLLLALPILGTTFWGSSNFHLWMLAFVLPTTALASIAGCRKHKNQAVAALTIGGVALLATATFWERTSLSNEAPPLIHLAENQSQEGESCGACCPVPSQGDNSNSLSLARITLSPPILLNLLGGVLLICGHWRNFRLCRMDRCCCST